MPSRKINNLLKHRLSASVSSSNQVSSVFTETFGNSISFFLSFSGSSISPSLNNQTSGSYLTNSLGIQNLRNQNRFIDTQITDRKNKSIMVCRFNAPGGIYESSRAALDPEAEEISPNNDLNTRNNIAKKYLNIRSNKANS